MSQNDMSIANASGGTVRADINSAPQALASANGGSVRIGDVNSNGVFDPGTDGVDVDPRDAHAGTLHPEGGHHANGHE